MKYLSHLLLIGISFLRRKRRRRKWRRKRRRRKRRMNRRTRKRRRKRRRKALHRRLSGHPWWSGEGNVKEVEQVGEEEVERSRR